MRRHNSGPNKPASCRHRFCVRASGWARVDGCLRDCPSDDRLSLHPVPGPFIAGLSD